MLKPLIKSTLAKKTPIVAQKWAEAVKEEVALRRKRSASAPLRATAPVPTKSPAAIPEKRSQEGLVPVDEPEPTFEEAAPERDIPRTPELGPEETRNTSDLNPEGETGDRSARDSTDQVIATSAPELKQAVGVVSSETAANHERRVLLVFLMVLGVLLLLVGLVILVAGLRTEVRNLRQEMAGMMRLLERASQTTEGCPSHDQATHSTCSAPIFSGINR
mmetsp:Transcript_397/g.1159  ORF Transcript_397/g.1159 Transcript_397/m.1159 type:complete len:219 (+) Transcript_397:236-892(+)